MRAQIDADGQHDPACIPVLLAPVMAEETAAEVGFRFLVVESWGVRSAFCESLSHAGKKGGDER